MTQSTPASTLENLARLASKPGVQSTLILSKTDGSIIRSTGLLSSSPSPLPASNLGGSASGAYSSQANPGPDMDTADENRNVVTDYGDKSDGVVQTAEDVAKMVYSFVSVAGGLVEGLNKGDEVKLLRLRTKRNELVIVPDVKFLLVVIHDTPPA